MRMWSLGPVDIEAYRTWIPYAGFSGVHDIIPIYLSIYLSIYLYSDIYIYTENPMTTLTMALVSIVLTVQPYSCRKDQLNTCLLPTPDPFQGALNPSFKDHQSHRNGPLPEGASTQHLRTLVPNTIQGMAFGTRDP